VTSGLCGQPSRWECAPAIQRLAAGAGGAGASEMSNPSTRRRLRPWRRCRRRLILRLPTLKC
jgi:hypothetical protein